MPKPIKILTFAGSTRQDSFHKKIAKMGAKLIKKKNIEATYIDLSDYTLPLYDGDYEANNAYPENAAKLKEMMKAHDGFLIASPEYNSSMTAVLKNTLDWISRSEEKGTDLSAFSGKVIGLVSASPGGLGGLRGLVHVRAILSNIGCFVIPNQLAISGVFSAFDENEELKDEIRAKQFDDVLLALIQTTKRFNIDLEQYCSQMFGDYCAQQMNN